MSALESMVGGTHYLGFKIQPNVFVAANNWDAFAQNILKYLVRWRHKGGLVDLEKAHHYARLRHELRMELHRYHEDGRDTITMNTFIRENDIPADLEPVLLALELWVMSSGNSHNIRAMFVATLEGYIAARRRELMPEDACFPA